jgi:hypothetical protein
MVAAAQERTEVYKIDFGPKETCAKGYIPVEARSQDPRFMWKGKAIGVRDRGGVSDMVNRDLVHGDRGEFMVGLDNGEYEVEITFGDKDFPHGPFDVFAQDKLAVKRLRTPKGEFITKTFNAKVTDERLRVKIMPQEEAPNFAVTSMIVRGPKQMKEHSLYSEAPPKTIPTVAELASKGKPDPKETLKAYCNWLLAHQTEEGFFNQNSSEWYRSSYPIRTLLAGYDIFGDKKYIDAVKVVLDKLVSEQLPNGAWSSGFQNKPVAKRTPEEIEKAMNATTNTADVGSISTCLAVAYPYVDEGRKKVYRDALKRFADDYAGQWQQSSGGFTNARWKGKDMTVPYSVATGTQGMSFCALYSITGDEKYLKVSERAANFLLDNWQEDGRPIHHHHEFDKSSVQKVTSFGDIYYYHEAILWVWNWTKNEALKDKIRRVYGWHVKGAQGLLQARENGVWWPVADTWTNSKAAAMPLVFIEYDRSMAKDAAVHEAVQRCEAFLCTPEFAKRIGVMVEPEMPWGEFSMAATGFGGLTVAELTEPGVIYLRVQGSGFRVQERQ